MSDDMKYEHTDKTKAADDATAPTPDQFVPAKTTDRGLFGFGTEEDKYEETPAAPAVESTTRGYFGFGGKKDETKSEETSPAASLSSTALGYFGFGKKKEEEKSEDTPIAATKADEYSAPKADDYSAPKADEYSAPKADDDAAPKAEESTTDRGFLGFGKKEEEKCDEPVIAAPKADEHAGDVSTTDRGFLGFGKKEEDKSEPKADEYFAPKAEENAAAKAEEFAAGQTTADRGLFGFGKKKEEEKCDDPMIVEPKADEHAAGESAADRGLFGFGKKKEEEKSDELAFASEFDQKAKICEEEKFQEPKVEVKEETKHESLLEKLRHDSSSSSSSDEEEIGEDGEKKKKKKGVKAKIAEKIKGNKLDEEVKCEDTSVPVDKYDAVPVVPAQQHHEEKYGTLPVPVPPQQHHEQKYDDVPVSVPTQEHEEKEKKGFLEKIKGKLPGGKKPEEMYASSPPVASDYATPEAEVKEKKGFMDKIKDKIPGYHHKTDEEKEKEKDAASY